MNQQTYPEIFYPEKDLINIKLKEYKNNKIGYSETFFAWQLSKYLTNYIKTNFIIDDNRDYPYQPDFLIHIPDYNLLIDIEIDEPYVYKTKEPSHIDDYKRNEYFLNKGCGVIRFCEEQVIKYPQLCCKVILEYIYRLTGNSIWKDGVGLLPELKSIKKWNDLEAKDMINDNYRDTYKHLLQNIVTITPDINILADGIYLNYEASEIIDMCSQNENLDCQDHISMSDFLKELSLFLYHFNKEEKEEKKEKIYVEFKIYISKDHSINKFYFDKDIFEFENYIIHIYYVISNDFIWHDITSNIIENNLQNVLLIADNPAYPLIINQDFKVSNLLLAHGSHDTYMPQNQYINIHYVLEKALNIIEL